MKNMKKLDELVEYLQEKNLICKDCGQKKEEEKSNVIVWVLAVIGAVAAVAAIAYAVYKYMTPDYLEDFEDDFDDDFEDDFFEDEEDEAEEPKKEAEDVPQGDNVASEEDFAE